MQQNIPTEWLYPASLSAAAEVQRLLAERVILTDSLPESPQYIGGADVSNNLYDPMQMIYAAMVTLDYPALSIQEAAEEAARASIPYQPGFLGFREAPVLIAAYHRLLIKPDVLMVDGHGVSHPRGLGIASHIGVLLDLPAIGVAKSILVGKLAGELGPSRGDRVPLVWKGQVIAMAVRTKPRTKPLFVSTGHRVSLETAIDWVLACHKGYRLPETTRQAHLAANTCRKRYPGVASAGDLARF